MVKAMCSNVTNPSMNDAFSPIPLVGLYIAAASMVCLLLILFDVWAGIKHRQHWFPCRLFSINSVTLSLISIAAKIPVDLTSEMPSMLDQLSKLFGTVFICATMSFMLPSVATNTEFESYANVTALSIFVITVIVNVGIQMATGVIFSFVVEHAIILIFMLFLLMRFWVLVTSINGYKKDHADVSKDLIVNGKANMLTRLKYCYLYGYHSCPQMYACRQGVMGDADAVCVMSVLVLVEAVLRSFISEDLRFFPGKSDYEWSMWVVVASQALTLALASFAVGSRWSIVIIHIQDYMKEYKYTDGNATYIQFQHFLSLRNLPSFMEKSFRYVIFCPLYIADYFITIFDLVLHLLLSVVYRRLYAVSANKHTRIENKEFVDLLESHEVFVVDWVLQKGLEDMERWMEIDEKVNLKYLTNMLSTVTPSQESPYKVGPDGKENYISSLSVMLLVEIAKLVIPPNKVSLTNVLAEVFEIVLFIENKVNTGSSKDILPSKLATVIHQYGLTSGAEEFVLKQGTDLENGKVPFVVEREPICRMCDEEGPLEICIHRATDQVSNFISYRAGEAREVVYGRIEQLFVDMLQAFLSHLPAAIYNHIVESPVEEYHDRVRLGLGFMSKLRSVESHIRFSLPSGSNIRSLFHNITPDTTTPVEDTLVQGEIKRSPNTTHAVKVFGEIHEDAQATSEQV